MLVSNCLLSIVGGFYNTMERDRIVESPSVFPETGFLAKRNEMHFCSGSRTDFVISNPSCRTVDGIIPGTGPHYVDCLAFSPNL